MSVQFGSLPCITGCGRPAGNLRALCLHCDAQGRANLKAWASGEIPRTVRRSADRPIILTTSAADLPFVTWETP